MEATDAQLKEYIEGKRQEMLDLWAEIVNTESGPKQLDGVNRVGDILQRELEKNGARVRRVKVDHAGDLIVGDWNPGSKEKPVVFMGHMDTVFPTHRTTSLYAEMGSETSSLRASYATNRSASCSFSTSSPLTAAFRHAEAGSAGSFASSPRVVVGRGVVSEGYDSNHLGSQYPSLLRQASSDQAPEDLVRTHHVKKLQSAK